MKNKSGIKMVAKYNGRECPVCGFHIYVGDKIYYYPPTPSDNLSSVKHQICVDEGPPVTMSDVADDWDFDKWDIDK